MTEENNILHDHIWTLFNHLKDSEDPELIRAACYFKENLDFDIDVLPDALYDCVREKTITDAESAYWN